VNKQRLGRQQTTELIKREKAEAWVPRSKKHNLIAALIFGIFIYILSGYNAAHAVITAIMYFSVFSLIDILYMRHNKRKMKISR